MLETIRIRKLGYPIRWTFDDFYQRFRLFAPKLTYKVGNQKAVAEIVEAVKKKHQWDETMWQVGVTKIFLRDIAVSLYILPGLSNLLQSSKLEMMRLQLLGYFSTKIQKTWRMYVVRRVYLKMHASAIVFQKSMLFW